jgi:hypothetical protein
MLSEIYKLGKYKRLKDQGRLDLVKESASLLRTVDDILAQTAKPPHGKAIMGSLKLHEMAEKVKNVTSQFRRAQKDWRRFFTFGKERVTNNLRKVGDDVFDLKKPITLQKSPDTRGLTTKKNEFKKVEDLIHDLYQENRLRHERDTFDEVLNEVSERLGTNNLTRIENKLKKEPELVKMLQADGVVKVPESAIPRWKDVYTKDIADAIKPLYATPKEMKKVQGYIKTTQEQLEKVVDYKKRGEDAWNRIYEYKPLLMGETRHNPFVFNNKYLVHTNLPKAHPSGETSHFDLAKALFSDNDELINIVTKNPRKAKNKLREAVRAQMKEKSVTKSDIAKLKGLDGLLSKAEESTGYLLRADALKDIKDFNALYEGINVFRGKPYSASQINKFKKEVGTLYTKLQKSGKRKERLANHVINEAAVNPKVEAKTGPITDFFRPALNTNADEALLLNTLDRVGYHNMRSSAEKERLKMVLGVAGTAALPIVASIGYNMASNPKENKQQLIGRKTLNKLIKGVSK